MYIYESCVYVYCVHMIHKRYIYILYILYIVAINIIYNYMYYILLYDTCKENSIPIEVHTDDQSFHQRPYRAGT